MPETLWHIYEDLFKKYKSKGVIIDSNLVLYFFIGSYDNNLVNRFKVTKKFGIAGFEILWNLIDHFDKIITTPHILTEISNLSNKLEGIYKVEYFNLFFQKLETIDELFLPAKDNFADDRYRKFGLTDAAIVNLSKTKSYLVLTDDIPLYQILLKSEIDVINFTHLFEYKFSFDEVY
ncbi:MAG: hypothetical protein A2X61_06165 [Ignavibacteria bacterium GWB2_35_12]|nr:MAG: hypothetical protein A2X63_09280 [Ignavibacteria bacterium GWA2_35_8]OGU39835.1 MAG: hypothetical protein A2X61_06165 [Ignavibacteria bacterium GWB2_35_12]OGU96246.1 MAG: hypothetical protein A2220_16585 [Ignavibacteria bacterium RIFOXYA2_FULL_35_10]OGV21465.1 MAG: hypothetical protein A2475_13745 [Ignavibacteria bacterium RIFOXYC2_FULL_35_21]